ncbi:MAG: hypothetical protein AAF735_00975, partial [Myxococcota bacterium]
ASGRFDSFRDHLRVVAWSYEPLKLHLLQQGIRYIARVDAKRSINPVLRFDNISLVTAVQLWRYFIHGV